MSVCLNGLLVVIDSENYVDARLGKSQAQTPSAAEQVGRKESLRSLGAEFLTEAGKRVGVVNMPTMWRERNERPADEFHSHGALGGTCRLDLHGREPSAPIRQRARPRLRTESSSLATAAVWAVRVTCSVDCADVS